MIQNARDLFDAIVVFENNVGKLYDNISEDVRKQFDVFFENMAKDEYRHAKIYEALGRKATEENLSLEDPEEAQYLSTLVSSSMLDSKENYLEQAKKIKNRYQILDIAEKVEREALQYIFELTRLFPDFAKEEVAILLKEEKKHLQMVLDRKKEAESGFLGL